MAEPVLAQPGGAGPVRPPAFLSVYLTNITQARDHLRDRFGIADAGALRAIDVSRFCGGLDSLSASSLLSRHPPLAVSVPDAVFDSMVRRLEGDESASGLFRRGTNVLFIRESLASDPRRFESIIRHELAHYLSYLVRGGRSVHASVSGPEGPQPFFAQWLEEGLADMASLHVSPGHSVTYPLFVSAISLLDSQIGSGSALRAFGTGDYSTLERAVDSRYGRGTFVALLRQDDPLLLMHQVLRLTGLPQTRPASIDEATWRDTLTFAANVSAVFGPFEARRNNSGRE